MALTSGTRLGPYEILAAIGAGGMGEVYRARDRKLNRDVAIKVLPEAFASDRDRLARFTREAQTLAALNHPNIAQIYGIENNALVMELVEGRDLSEIIAGQRHSAPAARPERGAERAEAERMGVGPHSQLRKDGLPVAVSSDGVLVYRPGEAGAWSNPIDWMTRDGRTSVLRAAKSDWSNLRFSPARQTLAFDITTGKERDIYVYEWARDTLRQLTFDPAQDRAPVWTPDGKRIVFGSDRAKAGVFNLYWVNADGTGDVQRLTDSPYSQQAFSWHPSSRFLAFQEDRRAASPSTGSDLMLLPMAGDALRGWAPGTPTVFLGTPANEAFPMFSPDGRWIAYLSGGIYVRPFSGSGGPWRVDAAGGIGPKWSTTTQELLYQDGTFRVMSLRYSVVGNSFRADKPELWSPTSIFGSSPTFTEVRYDLHPDGTRIGGVASLEVGNVVFVFNFFDYLRTIAPGKK